jgi:HEAT repeat protein
VEPFGHHTADGARSLTRCSADTRAAIGAKWRLAGLAVPDAFDGIDEYCWAATSPDGGSPDSALDWIFMMHDEDWQALREALPARPSEWREACAYILGSGPPDECLPFLVAALLTDDAAVTAEAAIGYSAQILEHDLIAQVTPEVRERLAQVVDACEGRHVEEVLELLARLRERGVTD